MGYITRDIAIIDEPRLVSLTNSSNFVTFASMPSTKVPIQVDVKINMTNATASLASVSILRITEPSGAIHSFSGTLDPALVSGGTFLVSSVKSDTAENLRRAMLADKWVGANFDVTVPFTAVGSTLSNGEVLQIVGKGFGADYNVTVVAPNNTANVAYLITAVSGPSVNDDSISGENATAEIALDLYTDPSIFLGQDDRPTSVDKLGTYATTLQKTYAGVPLWFDANSLFAQYAPYNRPPGGFGWFNTGTVRAYRFVAKIVGANSYPFYQSNALFAVSGYGPAFENLDLSPYIYNNNVIKLLTNKPRTSYVKGQKEYLNFILSDVFRGVSTPSDFSLRVAYRVYSTGDNWLGTIYSDQTPRASFNIVNTCALNIDAAIAAYPKAGIVRVALARDEALISNDLEYIIKPESLHKLRQVVFLNRLGGWDAYNFDALVKSEIKPTTDVYTKTVTPAMAKGDSIETIYNTDLAITNIVEGAPVSDEVAEWLKELAASSVIFDGDGNYIVKEDFTLPISIDAINMRTPTMKYHLSETYTND